MPAKIPEGRTLDEMRAEQMARRQQIAELVAAGMMQKDIATHLGMSITTVKSDLQRLRRAGQIICVRRTVEREEEAPVVRKMTKPPQRIEAPSRRALVLLEARITAERRAGRHDMANHLVRQLEFATSLYNASRRIAA